MQASAQKTLNLNRGDKAVLYAQFKEICVHAKEGLAQNQMMSGDHIPLGWWVIQRDLIEVGGACLVDPIVAYQISHGIAEEGPKIAEILVKAGILGIPIWAKEHWTLLVLRKMDKEVQVRYYDNLKEKSGCSALGADYILEFLRKLVPLSFSSL